MDGSALSQLVNRQKDFFNTHQTKDIGFRLNALKQIRTLVIRYEPEIHQALYEDLGRPVLESVGGDTGLVLQELGLFIRNLRYWTRPRRVSTPLVTVNARSYFTYEPYGNVLIISPWNYPFQLLFVPLIGAVAAGNCVLAKPSQYAAKTSEIMQKIIGDHFDPGFISVIKGGAGINEHLLEMEYDYIFFTGSQETGKKVMRSAAEHLTPVSLEMGGKNPVIIDKNIHLKNTAKRILWGKYLNAGQSCVAPDYMLVHEEIREALLEKMKEYLLKWMGPAPEKSKDFSRIIDGKNTIRLQNLFKQGKVVTGGTANPEEKYVAFTILDGISENDECLKKEIFGPVLPVLTYKNLDEAIRFVSSRPKPLSLYVFSKSKVFIKEVLSKTSSGSCCINETVVQFINPNLPFGGVGPSGMGRYHGRYSLETFSIKRSVMKTSDLIDIPVRYPPYGNKARLVSFLMR
jgi:aldehyde dehydrogenase (NAD+)